MVWLAEHSKELHLLEMIIQRRPDLLVAPESEPYRFFLFVPQN